jgi:uncharacterized protein (DUF302 family)
MTHIAGGDQGIVRIPSHYDVSGTIARLESLLRQRSFVVFAHIDFCADAARAGLVMRPEQLLIFGNPKGGTPLMVENPQVGIDLPLKALVWEDADGKTWIAYNDPQYIVRRHGLPPALAANLAAAAQVLERLATDIGEAG